MTIELLSSPVYFELSRANDRYSAMSTAALAALVVRPSTLANITLYNAESTGGKSYIIDQVFAHNLVSTAAISQAGIWYCVHPVGMTSPGVDDITVRNSSAGFTAAEAAAATASIFGVNEAVANNGWFPIGNSVALEVSGVLPGAQIVADVDGRFILPPTAGISFQVVASLAADTFTMGCSWWEANVFNIGDKV